MKNYIFLVLVAYIFTACSNNQLQNTTYTYKENKVSKKDIKKELKPNIILKEKTEEKTQVSVNNKIAVIFSPSTIGKYAIDTMNAINSYAIHEKITKDIYYFNLNIQDVKSIEDIFNYCVENDIKKVIALITNDIINDINIPTSLKTYFPLIHKSSLKKELTDNLIFGSIDYKAQFDKLIEYTKEPQYINFFDYSSMGIFLNTLIDSNIIKYKKAIDNNNGSYYKFLKENPQLENGTIILNTPIIKSSILLSQLSANKVIYKQILSTQINYSPLIFSLTQEEDRKNFIIVNSISSLPKDLKEYMTLNNNDVIYNWVNYSTIVGMEILYKESLSELEELKIEDGQVIYPIKLYKVDNNSFKLIKSKEE